MSINFYGGFFAWGFQRFNLSGWKSKREIIFAFSIIKIERLGSTIAPAKKPPVNKFYLSVNFYGGFFA